MFKNQSSRTPRLATGDIRVKTVKYNSCTVNRNKSAKFHFVSLNLLVKQLVKFLGFLLVERCVPHLQHTTQNYQDFSLIMFC